jgi:hypothetical protein
MKARKLKSRLQWIGYKRRKRKRKKGIGYQQALQYSILSPYLSRGLEPSSFIVFLSNRYECHLKSVEVWNAL